MLKEELKLSRKASCSVCYQNLRYFKSQLSEQKAQLEQLHQSEKAILKHQILELSQRLDALTNGIGDSSLKPMEYGTKEIVIPHVREKPRETTGEGWPPEHLRMMTAEQRGKELLRPFSHN